MTRKPRYRPVYFSGSRVMVRHWERMRGSNRYYHEPGTGRRLYAPPYIGVTR